MPDFVADSYILALDPTLADSRELRALRSNWSLWVLGPPDGLGRRYHVQWRQGYTQERLQTAYLREVDLNRIQACRGGALLPNTPCVICGMPVAVSVRLPTTAMPDGAALSTGDSLLNPEPPAKALNGVIKSVGVELESFLPDANYQTYRRWLSSIPRAEAHGDGSISPDHGTMSIEACFWSTDIAEMARWLDLSYRVWGTRSNHSCGFHVHLNPQPQYVSGFFHQHYWDSFYAAYAELIKTRGTRASVYASRRENGYSSAIPWSWEIATGQVNRRSAINVLSLQEQRMAGAKTVEHRIFPHQATAEEAADTVRWAVETATKILQVPNIKLRERNVTTAVSPQQAGLDEFNAMLRNRLSKATVKFADAPRRV